MEQSMKMFLVILLLLVATEEKGSIQVAFARECESQSHKYKGPCALDANCANICLTEGFSGGKCRGVRHHCLCTKHC